MSGSSSLSRKSLRSVAAGIAAALLATSSVAAQGECGLCNTAVVINGDLAACFIDRYADLAATADATVVVDLSDCASRGVVEALAGPRTGKGAGEPETMFMLSKEGLACLKTKIEEPGLELDPSVKIDLESCG